MKFINIFSIFISASVSLGSVAAPAPVAAAPVAPQPAVANTTVPATPAAVAPLAPHAVPANTTVPATPAAPAAPASPATPAAPGQMTPEQVLTPCSIPHVFTPEEIKSMNQVFGIAIILLQYQLFVNQDKTKEQETYNQLLKLWRTLTDMFKDLK